MEHSGATLLAGMFAAVPGLGLGALRVAEERSLVPPTVRSTQAHHIDIDHADSCPSEERDVEPHPQLSDLFVHYHYYENRTGMSWAEVLNKRTNLAVFISQAIVRSPPNVSFHITWNGDALPTPDLFYSSINLTAPSSSATVIPTRPNVVVEKVAHSTTDLCPRAHALRSSRNNFSHMLFVNDGARGPFATSTSESLSWIRPYRQAFSSEHVAAAGVSMSCEVAPHLQSWALMIDSRVKDIFLSAYGASCSQSKSDAIMAAEVGPFSRLLSRGYNIASFFAPVSQFGAAEASCLTASPTRLPMLRSSLNDCHNPYGSDGRQMVWPDSTRLDQLGFVKFGGEQWRQGMLPENYVARVRNATATMIGTSCCAPAADE